MKTRLIIWIEKTIFLRYSKIGLKIILTKILPHIGNRKKKLVYSFVEAASPFLWISTTFDFFQLLGKDPLCKQFLKITDRGFTIEELHIFTNLIDISSYPCALLIFKERIMLRISWSLTEINDKLALVTGLVTRGKVLLCETDVQGLK